MNFNHSRFIAHRGTTFLGKTVNVLGKTVDVLLIFNNFYNCPAFTRKKGDPVKTFSEPGFLVSVCGQPAVERKNIYETLIFLYAHRFVYIVMDLQLAI